MESLFLKTVIYRNYILLQKGSLPVTITPVTIITSHIPTELSLSTAVFLRLRRRAIERWIERKLEKTMFEKATSSVIKGLRIVNWALVIAPAVYEFLTPNTMIDKIGEQFKRIALKDKIREDLIKHIIEEVGENYIYSLTEVKKEIEESLYSFEKGNKRLIELFEKVPELKDFTNTLTQEEFNNFAILVGEIPLSPEGCKKYLLNGTLKKILRVNIEEFSYFITIVKDKGVEDGLKWHNIAPDKLPVIVERKIYLNFSPDTISNNDIIKLLNIKDTPTYNFLVSQNKKIRSLLLSAFSEIDLKEMANTKDAKIFIDIAEQIKGKENLEKFWQIFRTYPQYVKEEREIIKENLKNLLQARQSKYLSALQIVHSTFALLPFLYSKERSNWLVSVFQKGPVFIKWFFILIGIALFFMALRIIVKVIIMIVYDLRSIIKKYKKAQNKEKIK